MQFDSSDHPLMVPQVVISNVIIVLSFCGFLNFCFGFSVRDGTQGLTNT